MKNNILKTLTNNLGFKILALFFAFTLWLVVYNLEDPTKSKTLTINVNIENRESIENMGKYYEVVDGSNKVSFSITAARSVLDKLDESDFVATADMDQIVIEEESARGTVPIEILCTANISQNSYKLSSTGKTLKVALEDLMIKQFVVSARVTGMVAEGYALGEVEITAPNVLKVSGPKSIVQKITAAVATIDVSGMSDSWTTYKAKPVLYDKDGKEVDETRLTKSDSTVTVSAEILNTKEVSIAVKPAGTPADGYTVTAINSNPTTILLKGNKAVLNAMNSIEIPDYLISVEGKSKDVEATIDVTEYIPEGVTLVEPEESTVEITVSIGKIKEKVFRVQTENIIVTGLSNHSKLEFELSSIAVHILGLEEDIANLSSEALSGSIDVTYLPIGIHEVELMLDLDENKYSYLPIKVTVYIKDASIPDVNETEE
ncbi:MAG: hypothetical protein IJA07_07735 [Agathobacter sp.]|nr:hypothetical protein [Agathobacter sp.]